MDAGVGAPRGSLRSVIYFLQGEIQKQKPVEAPTQRTLGRRIRHVIAHIKHIRQESGRDTFKAQREQQP